MNYSTNALLTWVSQITKKPVSNLNQLSTGVHFGILLNHMLKGRFGIHKINFQAKMQVQKLNNLKKLIDGMKENKIDQSFDITKIAKESKQQILWALQWFRKEMDKRDTGSERQSKSKQKKNFRVTYKKDYDTRSKSRPKIIQKDQTGINPITKDFFNEIKVVNLVSIPNYGEDNKPNQAQPRDQQKPQVLPAQEIKYPQINFYLKSEQTQNNSNIANINTSYRNTTANLIEEKREKVDNPRSERIQNIPTANPILQKYEEKPISQKRSVRFTSGEGICRQNDAVSRSKENRSLSKKKSCLKSPSASVKVLANTLPKAPSANTGKNENQSWPSGFQK